MVKLYILHETSLGYTLFKKEEGEEIGAIDLEIQKAWQDIGRFKQAVKFVAVAPFKDTEHALENINALSEGQVTQFLASFLSDTLPAKKDKYQLGVAEAKLGSTIQENLGIKCVANEFVLEMQRCLRFHAGKLIPSISEGVDVERACLGLAHCYSRSKVKFNVNRADNMIIQAIAVLDKLDKDINTFAMRLKEWYSWHFPELIKIVPDNAKFAQLAAFIKNKEEVTEDMLEGITAIVDDEQVAAEVLNMCHHSMGGAISEVDMVNIESFAQRLDKLFELRSRAAEYLHSKIEMVSPNLGTLMGDNIAARLIGHAGSLINLAKYPASTVQILGAEKGAVPCAEVEG
eukprot:Sspe_Gene.885::Locus_301_Transcript_2_2_Confidence_0.833_Length_1570::g.885::m.885/K14564/NOP56; nucleolar protein 56